MPLGCYLSKVRGLHANVRVNSEVVESAIGPGEIPLLLKFVNCERVPVFGTML